MLQTTREWHFMFFNVVHSNYLKNLDVSKFWLTLADFRRFEIRIILWHGEIIVEDNANWVSSIPQSDSKIFFSLARRKSRSLFSLSELFRESVHWSDCRIT